MKILFLNLPYKYKISRSSRWPEKTKSGTLYYPYWLAYAAGAAKKDGNEIFLIDAIARGWSDDQTIQEILLNCPDILVAEVTTPTVFEDLKFLSSCKAKGFKGKIVIAGNHATVFPKEILQDFQEIDCIAVGEYDYTIPDLAKNLDFPEKVPGIVWRKNGKIVTNKTRPFIEDLDSLPFVSKIYKEYLRFSDYGYSLARHPMIQILSSRGCPYKCSFCLSPQTAEGRKYRKRSVSNFVEELEYIANELPQINEVFIEDDTFTVDTNRVREICELIISKGLKLCWSANVRADLPLEIMKKMKKAGCRLMVVGFESGNQKILDLAEKGITVKQSLLFASNSKKAGIKFFGCFMVGLPGETIETIDETFNLAKKLDADMVFFQQAVPFPGTKFYQWALANNRLATNDFSQWMNEQGQLRSLVSLNGLCAEEIEKIRDRLMIKYYFSVKYLFNTLLRNRNINELLRVMMGALSYLRYLFGKQIMSHEPKRVL
jgi:radical SAM superfamily enzyme YgiQ (UPF0313 family)